MLVLTRGKEESIVLGDNVTITIIDIRGDKVRIGIEAPRDLVILRKEIYDTIRRENVEAADSKLDDLDNLDGFLNKDS